MIRKRTTTTKIKKVGNKTITTVTTITIKEYPTLEKIREQTRKRVQALRARRATEV